MPQVRYATVAVVGEGEKNDGPVIIVGDSLFPLSVVPSSVYLYWQAYIVTVLGQDYTAIIARSPETGSLEQQLIPVDGRQCLLTHG